MLFFQGSGFFLAASQNCGTSLRRNAPSSDTSAHSLSFLLAPITLGIVLFHLILGPTGGAVLGYTVFVLEVALIIYWHKYSRTYSARFQRRHRSQSADLIIRRKFLLFLLCLQHRSQNHESWPSNLRYYFKSIPLPCNLSLNFSRRPVGNMPANFIPPFTKAREFLYRLCRLRFFDFTWIFKKILDPLL